jgi:hypothetical protein
LVLDSVKLQAASSAKMMRRAMEKLAEKSIPWEWNWAVEKLILPQSGLVMEKVME